MLKIYRVWKAGTGWEEFFTKEEDAKTRVEELQPGFGPGICSSHVYVLESLLEASDVG